MKFLWVIIFSFSLNISDASWSPSDIPHYKVYPKTEAVEYKAEILDFYSVRSPYGEFSNFALFPIIIDDVIWPTSEHYYQAQKFFDPLLKELVRQAPTPYQAAVIGRDPNLPMRADWDDVRDAVMLIALRAKFSQYQILQDLLRSTGSSKIYEHTKNDCYWGDCGDRTGVNRLGEQLMLIRSEIAI